MDTNGKLVIDHSQTDDNRCRLVLSGDLDIQTAPQLRKFIDRLIREGNINLTLDLGKLSYLDSSGYFAIVDATRATRGKVDIANLPNWMTEFFDMSVLDSQAAESAG
jgi:anti-anti-sigma factor